MASDVFTDAYSQVYDVLYREKDYEAECDFLEEIFKRASIPVRRILDLGCGTGGHAVPLSRRGYEVCGVERSARMLRIAQRKAREAHARVQLVHGDLRELNLGRSFDAVIAMFAVMSYQRTNNDLAAACRTAAGHLAPGGVFAFDAWHGSAVLTDPPKPRLKIAENGDKHIIRFTHPELDATNQTARITFTVWVVEGQRLVSQDTETHVMRFLFPQETAYFLHVAGFNNTQFCPFMEIDRPLDSNCWNLAAITFKPQP